MIPPIWFALGLGIPAAAALGLMLLSVQPGRAGLTPAATERGWALGVAVGVVLAALATFGPLSLDPRSAPAEHLLAGLVLLAGLIEAGATLGRVAGWVAWPMRVGVLVVAPWLLLRPLVEHEWSAATAAWWLLGTAAGLLLLVLGGRAMARVAPGRELGPVIGLAAVGAGITIIASGSLTLGQMGLALGGVMAGGSLVTIWLGGDLGSRGSATVPLAAYGLLLVAGYHYTYDPYNGVEGLRWFEAVGLAAAPLLGWVAATPLPGPLGLPVARTLIRTAAILLPVALIAGFNLAELAAEMSGGPSDPYSGY